MPGQVVYKLPGTKSSLLGPKGVPRPLFKRDCTHSNRKHHSGCLHKQGRTHEVGPLWPTMENPYPVLQETGDPQGPTHSRPAECGSRQTILARPDHPDRVVSPSRGLPVDMLHFGTILK